MATMAEMFAANEAAGLHEDITPKDIDADWACPKCLHRGTGNAERCKCGNTELLARRRPKKRR